MSDTVGGTNIRLGVNPSGVPSGLSEARKQFKLFASDVNATLINTYRKADSEQRAFRGGLTRLGNELQDVSKKMALVSAGSIFAGAKSFKDFATIERMEKGLNLYSETLQDVRRIAKEPGVGIFDGTKALVGLRAVRLESGLAERAVKSFANAIAGSGGESSDLEPALFNLKQFKATNNINTVDLRQLANRIPQTMEVLEKQFGTADPAKLNQLGIDKFIEGFVSGLEKLPKVSGGANMALEQLGDSATFFSATLGKGIDTTYGVTGVLKTLGGVLDDLSTNFASLNPEAQKTILLVGGLAVAVPLLVGAIGTLIKFLPITAAGFAGISWPVVAVLATVSAMAGLAAIMPLVTSKTAEYNRQQEVVAGFATKLDPLLEKYQKLKDSTGTKEQAELRDVIKQISEVVPSAVTGWDRYGNAIGVNTDKVKTYTQEQRKLLTAMQDVRREQLLAENKKSEVRKADLQNLIRSGNTTDYLGMGVYQSRSATNSELVSAAQQIADLNAKGVANRRELLSLGGQDIYVREANKLKEMQALRSKYSESYKAALKGENSQLITSINDKSAALDKDIATQRTKVNLMVNMWNQAKVEARERGAKVLPGTPDSKVEEKEIAVVKAASKAAEEAGTHYSEWSKAKQDLHDIEISSKTWEEAEAVKSATDNYKSLVGVVKSLKLAQLELSNTTGSTIGQSAYASKGLANSKLSELANYRMQNSIRDIKSNSYSNNLSARHPKIEGETPEEYKMRLDGIQSITDRANAEFSQSLRSAAAEVSTSFGEMLGNLVNGEGALGSFRSRVLSILGSLLKDIGKSLVALGVAGEAFNFFRDKPALAYAAGVALSAVGQVVANSAQKKVSTTRFAAGGFAFREMPAIVGDNANARFDPEMIAPYSKVHDSIKKSVKESSITGDRGRFVASAVVKGRDLVILIEREQASMRGLRAQ